MRFSSARAAFYRTRRCSYPRAFRTVTGVTRDNPITWYSLVSVVGFDSAPLHPVLVLERQIICLNNLRSRQRLRIMLKNCPRSLG